MARARGDTFTGDLLDWQPPQVEARLEDGAIRGSELAAQICQAVAAIMDTSGLSREEIARRMTEEHGCPISVHMLNNYASEAAVSARITLERFMALVAATGCHGALGFIAGRFGHVAVPERYASVIELHLLEEHEREIVRRKQAAEARWRASK